MFGFENLKIIENIQNEFLRKITKSRSSIPMYMLYAELGRFPIDIIIKSRAITFWNRLITGKQSKLSFILYQAFYKHEKPFKWIGYIKGIFSEIGRNDFWIYQNDINSRSINKYVKSVLIDQNL